MSREEQLEALSTHLNEACSAANGWDELSADQQSAITHDAWFTLAFTLRREEFSALLDEEKKEARFFVWIGCCMHMELNTFKGHCNGNCMSQDWGRTTYSSPEQV